MATKSPILEWLDSWQKVVGVVLVFGSLSGSITLAYTNIGKNTTAIEELKEDFKKELAAHEAKDEVKQKDNDKKNTRLEKEIDDNNKDQQQTKNDVEFIKGKLSNQK